MCLVLRRGKNPLRGRGAQLLGEHVQPLFSGSDAVVHFTLCPASLYPGSCLGHPVRVSVLTAQSGVQWGGVALDDVTVGTLSFCGVCSLLAFRGVMEKSFMEYYDFYEGVCKERLYLQGQTMQVSGR